MVSWWKRHWLAAPFGVGSLGGIAAIFSTTDREETMMSRQFRRSGVTRGPLVRLMAIVLGSFAIEANVPAADEAASYKIQAFHPLKVGDQLHLKRDIELTLTGSTTVDGNQRGQQTLTMQVKFAGNLKALEVDPRGAPLKWEAYTEIATGAQSAGGKHVELLKPGTMFTAQWQGGTVTITVADTRLTLSEDARTALARVFQASGGKGEMSLGEVLDSKSPQAVGGNWEINASAAAEQLHSLDPKLNASEVSGKARLKAVAGPADKRVLEVEYQYTAKTKDPANPPTGMTPLGALREEIGSLTIPADLSTGYVAAHSTVRLSGKFKKTENKQVPVHTGSGSNARTTTKDVTSTTETTITSVAKINTVIIYQRVGGVDLKIGESAGTSSKAP